MTGSNHICLTDNSLCVPMVMNLIIFLSLVGSLKTRSVLVPLLFFAFDEVERKPNFVA